MEEYKQIGLNIWGIRAGFRNFCHSDNLDISTPEIANTWGDIRDIVYVSDLNVRFYALEFTPNYKVFTIYRPENDGGGRSGAYVATTVYVPHALKVNNILELLKQISDAYHKDHYDGFSNPKNAPDYIHTYIELVKNFAANIVREDVVRPWESSAQNNTPCLLPFSSLDVVANFFATPYRSEFKQHQEVMFWDATHVQNPNLFGVKFLKTMPSFKTDGEDVAGQFEGGHILNDPPAGLTLAVFKREGADITAHWRSATFYDNTTIEVELRKPYHRPLKYSGTMAGFSGNPFTKQGDDYRFNSTVACQPYDYEAVLRTPEAANLPFSLQVAGKTVAMSGGRGTFRFGGNEVGRPCEVTLTQGDNRFKIGEINLEAHFKGGAETPDALQECVVSGLKTFRFRFSNDCAGQFCIAYKNPIAFATAGREYAVVLPAATKLAEMSFKVDGHDADLKAEGDANATVTLTPNVFNVEVAVPVDLQRYMASSQFTLKVDGVTYRSQPGSFVIAGLPKKAQGTLQAAAKLGLSVGGATAVPCRHSVEADGDNLRLRPELMLVNNEANERAEVVIADVTMPVAAGTQCVLPLQTGSGWLRNATAFQVMQPERMEGYHLLTLKRKPAEAAPATPTPGTDRPGYQGPKMFGPGSGGNRKVVGLYRFEGTERKLYEDECTRLADGVYAFALNGKTCTLCFAADRSPDHGKQKRQDDNNRDNGFVVKPCKANPKGFEVEALPGKQNPTAGPADTSGKPGGGQRWWIFGGIGLVVLLLAGGVTWWLLRARGNNDQYKGEENSLIETGDVEDTTCIRLFEGWLGLEIKIKTVGEGDCSITIDPANKITTVEGCNIDTTSSGDVLKITVTSPAWVELGTSLSENDSIKIYMTNMKPNNYSGIKGSNAKTYQTIKNWEPEPVN